MSITVCESLFIMPRGRPFSFLFISGELYDCEAIFFFSSVHAVEGEKRVMLALEPLSILGISSPSILRGLMAIY